MQLGTLQTPDLYRYPVSFFSNFAGFQGSVAVRSYDRTDCRYQAAVSTARSIVAFWCQSQVIGKRFHYAGSHSTFTHVWRSNDAIDSLPCRQRQSVASCWSVKSTESVIVDFSTTSRVLLSHRNDKKHDKVDERWIQLCLTILSSYLPEFTRLLVLSSRFWTFGKLLPG